MLMKSVIALVATSALAAKLVQHLSHKQQQRRVRHDQERHRDDVSRWEAEGGNLPVKPATETPPRDLSR
jgi:Ni/Co efflux regulator RcnB